MEGFSYREGETVLWQGSPRQGIRFYQEDFFVIPAALLLMCFVSAKMLLPMPLILRVIVGLPLLSIIFFRSIAVPFSNAYLLKRTHYEVTNRRLIIVTNLSKQPLYWWEELDALKEIMLFDLKPDSSATIVFGDWMPYSRSRPPRWHQSRRRFYYERIIFSLWPGFRHVERANEVRKVIEEARSANKEQRMIS